MNILHGAARCGYTRLAFLWLACALAVHGTGEDDTLKRARALAVSKHRPEALELLRTHLTESPNDVDARLLQGLILSWERRYDEAREELTRVLTQTPAYRDARIALVNVELWSEHPERAEQVAREGLLQDPHDTDLLLATGRALRAQKRNVEALGLLKDLLRISPANSAAQELRDSVRDDLRPWSASFDYSRDSFGQRADPWHEYQLQLRRSTRVGSVVARVERANRFGLHGNQVEFDFYPRIRAGTYAYVSAGVSPDSTLYPQYRAALELYQSLGHGYEASGGFRRLGFTAPVNIYTASIGKYYGNWLFGARSFVTPDAAGSSASVYLSARYYSGEMGDYIGFRVGHGSTPVEISNITDLAILNSTSGQIEYFKTYNRNLTFGIRAGLSREDRLRTGTANRFSFSPSIALRF